MGDNIRQRQDEEYVLSEARDAARDAARAQEEADRIAASRTREEIRAARLAALDRGGAAAAAAPLRRKREDGEGEESAPAAKRARPARPFEYAECVQSTTASACNARPDTCYWKDGACRTRGRKDVASFRYQREARLTDQPAEGSEIVFSGNPEQGYAMTYCPICMEDKEQHDLNREADAPPYETAFRHGACGHRFHESCLSEWMQQTENCPVCRAEIVLPPSLNDRLNQAVLANQRGAARALIAEGATRVPMGTFEGAILSDRRAVVGLLIDLLGMAPRPFCLDRAIRRGRVDLVRILMERTNVLPTGAGLAGAVVYDAEGLIRFALEKGMQDIRPAYEQAISLDRRDLVELFIEHGTAPIREDFTLAVAEGARSVVNLLVARGIHPSQVDVDSAVILGNVELVRAFGGVPSRDAFNGAVAGGHAEVVELLMSERAMEAPDDRQFNEAVASGHADLVVNLVRRHRMGPPTRQAFSRAVMQNHVDVVSLFDSMPVSNEAFTVAVERGHEDVIHYLLDAGTVPDQADADTAIRANRPQIVRLFQEQGVRPSSAALASAIQRGLTAAVAEVGFTAEPGWLELAIRGGNVMMVRLLVQHRDAVPNEEHMRLAILQDQPAMVDFFLRSDVEPPSQAMIELVVENDQQPIMVAFFVTNNLPMSQRSVDFVASRGHVHVVRRLAERGQLPGQQHLDDAVARGDAGVVLALVEWGMMPSVASYNLAVERNHEAVVEILNSRGMAQLEGAYQANYGRRRTPRRNRRRNHTPRRRV